MLEQLAVINFRQGAERSAREVHNGLAWQTCLRRILFLNRLENGALIAGIEGGDLLPVEVISSASTVANVPARPRPQAVLTRPSNAEVYRGEDAYGFLLEVICGLNSPLIGETAVMGQFRDFRAQTRFPNTSWGWFLRQLTSNLLVDAKRVRHDHLQGLGSQSYGSLVRQHVAGMPMVAVLGAGQLAREILPWLIGKTKVRLFYRNWLHAKGLQNEYPEIQLEQFSVDDAGWEPETGLVIAAPLKAVEVEKWIALQGMCFQKCLDLRGDATTDPVSVSFPVIKLSELFDALRHERQRLKGQVASARAAIKLLTRRHAQQAQFRPFGWEDLCA